MEENQTKLTPKGYLALALIVGFGVLIPLSSLAGEETSSKNYVSNEKPKTTVETLVVPESSPTPIPTTFVPRVYSGSSSFMGYPCTEDCSGHEAGYEWAEENGINDEDDCGGNSDSFIEGCQAYVEENYYDSYQDEYEEDYDY